jgi:hypothetical protein
MNTFLRGFALAAVLSLGALAFSGGTAHAQVRRPGTVVGVGPAPVVNPFVQNRVVPVIPSVAAQSINRNPYITPNLTLNQYAYNMSVLGQAYSTIPPYALGYNPYPQVVNYGPVYSGYYNPYLTGYNPYLNSLYNPYLGYYYP